MKKVLITGATGFVGSHLTRTAVQRDLAVRALVRPSADVAALRELGVELFTGDLTDARSIDGCCEGVDAVVHTAAELTGRGLEARDRRGGFLAINRDGTANLARQVLRHDGLRMVHVSSTGAMGTPRTSFVDETTPVNPVTPYQVSKRQAEIALLDLHRREGLNVVILRPCLVAGEGDRTGQFLKLFRLVKRGMFPLIGPSDQLSKPLVMVDDLVDAILAAIDRGRPGEIYLVHSDGNHTLGEIIDVVGRLTGARRTHVRIPEPLARVAARVLKTVGRVVPGWTPPLTPERLDLFLTDRHLDISKARDELGFSPRHQSLEEILGRTYRHYAERGLI